MCRFNHSSPLSRCFAPAQVVLFRTCHFAFQGYPLVQLVSSAFVIDLLRIKDHCTNGGTFRGLSREATLLIWSLYPRRSAIQGRWPNGKFTSLTARMSVSTITILSNCWISTWPHDVIFVKTPSNRRSDCSDQDLYRCISNAPPATLRLTCRPPQDKGSTSRRRPGRSDSSSWRKATTRCSKEPDSKDLESLYRRLLCSSKDSRQLHHKVRLCSQEQELDGKDLENVAVCKKYRKSYFPAHPDKPTIVGSTTEAIIIIAPRRLKTIGQRVFSRFFSHNSTWPHIVSAIPAKTEARPMRRPKIRTNEPVIRASELMTVLLTPPRHWSCMLTSPARMFAFALGFFLVLPSTFLNCGRGRTVNRPNKRQIRASEQPENSSNTTHRHKCNCVSGFEAHTYLRCRAQEALHSCIPAASFCSHSVYFLLPVVGSHDRKNLLLQRGILSGMPEMRTIGMEIALSHLSMGSLLRKILPTDNQRPRRLRIGIRSPPVHSSKGSYGQILRI